MKDHRLKQIVEYLKAAQLKIVTAESCTAGLIASTLAEPPGSGQWLECAYVAYSEDAKIECLNVAQSIIDAHGLTSEEVAREMAKGALATSRGNLAISTTGVAGPSSGDGSEAVGTVCFAWCFQLGKGMRCFTETHLFEGERNEVREAAALFALERIESLHHSIE